MSLHTRVRDLALSLLEIAKRLNLRTGVVIDPVRTAVVTDPVEALSLRPGRSSVVTDLLVPLELPRFFHQDLLQVQARATTGAFSHLPHTIILHIYILYMHTATEVVLPESRRAESLYRDQEARSLHFLLRQSTSAKLRRRPQ